MSTLRQQAAALAARVRGADVIALPPPRLTVHPLHVDAGCVVCGLAVVEVPAGRRFNRTVEMPATMLGPAPAAMEVGVVEARDLSLRELNRAGVFWRLLVADPASLGAARAGRAGHLRGWLCPTCDQVRDREPLGVGFVLACVKAHAPDPGVFRSDVELPSAVGMTFASRVVAARLGLEAEPEPCGRPFCWVDLSRVEVADGGYPPDVDVQRLDLGDALPVIDVRG